LRITPAGARTWVLGCRDLHDGARRFALGKVPAVGLSDAPILRHLFTVPNHPIQNVSGRTGIDPNATLNTSDPAQMASLLKAINRNEKGARLLA